MNRKAKRAQLLKECHDAVANAKAAARELTTEELAEIEAKLAEVAQLDIEIKQAEQSDALMQRLADFGTPADNPSRPVDSAKSLGEHFVKSLGDRSLKTPGTFQAPEFKAATDTQAVGSAYGPALTEVDRNFVMPVRRAPVIADLLQWGTLGGNAVTYPVFGATEGGTGTVTEGGTKPQMHVVDPTWVTDQLSEIAGWFKMTDIMAEDLPWVADEINTTALYDLAMKEESQLLDGNGTAPNLRGILLRSGIQTETQAATGDDPADAIFRAMTKVQTGSGTPADGIVINPLDYQALRLKKDANGQYYGGGFFQGAYGIDGLAWQPPIWGLRTIVSAAVPAKTVLVGAFMPSAKAYRKGGIRVESTNSNQDDFITDKITVRVRERVALAVRRPSGFVKVTLV